jgi:hypothetical protein
LLLLLLYLDDNRLLLLLLYLDDNRFYILAIVQEEQFSVSGTQHVHFQWLSAMGTGQHLQVGGSIMQI